MNRLINVTTALGDRLRFSALSGREEISHLFDFSLTLKSEDDNLSTEAMLGTSVTLDIELPGGGMRYLNGQCVHFAAVGRAGRFHLYEARLKPWLWYATQRTDYRIFQQMTAPDMIRQVLADYPFEVRLVLSRSYRDWEYCVQYQESDANFVMRMMENEGIWFWFDHSAGEHALVLTDDIGLRDPFPGYGLIPYFAPDQTYPDRDHLDTWSAGQQVLSGQFMARDYNFTMPKADLAVIGNQQPGHAHDSYRHGKTTRRPRSGGVDRRNQIPDMVSIHVRPPETEDRLVPGHWEGDLIKGKDNASAVGTLVERTSGYLMLVKMRDATATSAVEGFSAALNRVPLAARKSMTYDQGREMTRHADITQKTGVAIYFCDPHSPWQRGSNENINGLIRQYLPKGTDLSVHSQEELNEIAFSLNRRPRKRFGFKCPIEVLSEVIHNEMALTDNGPASIH